MYSTESLKKLIESKLSESVKVKEPVELYEPVNYMVSLGGKRIRPIITLMTCEMFKADVEKHVDLAIALELFHNFTLMHDDIMDNARLRRGKETVHVKWDMNRAILSGDLLFTIAGECIRKGAGDNLNEALELFNDTSVKVCAGQQWDMTYETTNHITLQEYLRMIEHKTASLLGACLKMGAIAANAPADEKEKLYNAGVNIGLAFQLKDDLLDLYGQESKTGKSIGGDIAANKKTILLILALENASENQQKILQNWFSNNDEQQRDEKVIAVKSVFDALNIQNRTHALIEDYYNLARREIESLAIEQNRKEPMLQLFEALMGREH